VKSQEEGVKSQENLSAIIILQMKVGACNGIKNVVIIFNLNQKYMSGRGDNNKHGSAGRGASNQSNEPFVGDGEKQKKSNHNKHSTGGKASRPQPKTRSQSSNRNTSVDNDKP
jgi:hypothetical protein